MMLQIIKLIQEGTPPNYEELLSSVVELLLAVAVPIVLRQITKYIRTHRIKLDLENANGAGKFAETCTKIAVKASHELLDNLENREKISLILDVVEKELLKQGIEIELDILIQIIEAAIDGLEGSLGDDTE